MALQAIPFGLAINWIPNADEKIGPRSSEALQHAPLLERELVSGEFAEGLAHVNAARLAVGFEPRGGVHRVPQTTFRNPGKGSRFIVVISPSGRSPMRLSFIRRFFQKQRRTSPVDFGQFGRDVREVILARTSLAVAGKLSEVEASRMVLEKQSAAIHAQLSWARALMKGDLASANREVFDIYRSAVQSNRKRLRKLRRR